MMPAAPHRDLARPSAVVCAVAVPEIDVRRPWRGGSFGAALWNTDLGSELVYVGDEGTTEPRGERSPTTELHFTPGAPRSVTIGLEVRY